MRDRFPISGIKQSYNHTSETRTVLMPLVITTVMGGLVAFFFLSKPKESGGAALVADVAKEAELIEETVKGNMPKSEVIPVSLFTSPPDSKPGAQESSAPTESSPTAHLDRFTPWMSPIDLDAYILEKNEGHSQSFWKRGYWITAVEGRWHNGGHEFRIAYDRTPNSPDWQWQYRVNQTPESFLKSTRELRAEGFRIVQVQSFDHPDNKRRYQTVWERTISLPEVAEPSEGPVGAGIAEKAPTVPTSKNIAESGIRKSFPSEPAAPLSQVAPERLTPLTQPSSATVAENRVENAVPTEASASSSSTALDVNNLNFR